jgi:DNA-binding response OmpR family regulator
MLNVWRICVIEDDVPLNQKLVNALREEGYTVQGVMNSTDAVRTLWSEEHDVVICNQKLSGDFELLRWLRSSRPNARTIVLGNASETEERKQRLQALESGAISYIPKPVDLRLLKDELHRLLQQAGFTANLDSFDLLDVIQVIPMSRKSITLLIHTGLEEHGTLRFHNGDLVWAEYGALRGEEAFFALAASKNGTVAQHLSDEPLVVNVKHPLSRLIFQALQYRTKDANEQPPLRQGSIETTGLTPVLQSDNFSPSAHLLLDDIDDSPFVFTSEVRESNTNLPAEEQSSNEQGRDAVSDANTVKTASVSDANTVKTASLNTSWHNNPDSIQQMPQVPHVGPAASVPQVPFSPIAQLGSPVTEQMNFPQPNQFGYPPLPSTKENAAQNRRAKRGIIIGSVITLMLLVFATGAYAIRTHTVAGTPTPTAIAQAQQKNTPRPTQSPTPMPTPTPTPTLTPTPTPTPVPQLQPTPPVGVNGNPWGYDFNPGKLIYNPPANFCTYFNCVRNFWDSTSGYVNECKDETYSHSGGTATNCLKHGGEMRPLYSH